MKPKLLVKPIVVSAHQPNFFPYLGFFDKMQKSDIFVIRDEVLYIKKEYHNRNRIRINGHDPKNPQSKWISVPVHEQEDFIKHIKIKKDAKDKNMVWNKKILREININYSKAPYFDKYYPKIEEIFNKGHESLLSLNMDIIKFLVDSFGIKTKIILASELKLKPEHYEKSDASEDLINICKKLEADVYLSGAGAIVYLKKELFEKSGIKLEFQNYVHPKYQQTFPGFLPYMSSLDALFNIGKFPEATELNKNFENIGNIKENNKELNFIELKH